VRPIQDFHDVVKILDWPHLFHKMRDAVRALQPGKRADRRTWRKEQYDILFPLLGLGQREQALAHLQEAALHPWGSSCCF
jgi:hypothetical protein